MALLSDQRESRTHSRVGGVVLTFLENLEFVRAMETLIRRHKYAEAARVALLIGEEEKAAELFLRGRDYTEAANHFVRLDKLDKAAAAFKAGGDLVKAAEMYLKTGQPVMAAHMLLQAGEEERAMTILEQQASEYERLYVMAMVWTNKGEYDRAAQAYFKAGHYEEAAQAFEQAGDYSRAAEAFLKAGKGAKAARAMETAGRQQDAIRLYEKVGLLGEAARVASAEDVTDSDVIRLANKGDLFAAGLKAYKQKNYPLAERLLRAMKPGQKGYNRSTLILGRICKEDGRMEEAREYLKAYLLNGPLGPETLPAMKFALEFLEEVGDLETCLTGMKRLKEANLLDKELKEKLHQLEIRHVQNMLGNAIPLEAWVRKGSKPQVMGIDDKQLNAFLGQKYQINKKLKDTGAVTTFRAYTKPDRTEVQIRVLHAWKMVVRPELKKIIDDTQRVNKLRHPNIIQTLEGGMMDNAPYVVTMPPPGSTLQAQLMERGGSFSIKETLRIVSGMAGAIDYAHKQGFVHKGISPECIYIDNSGNPILTGLGVPDARFDKQGPILWGDPMFLSPEARMGRMVTRSSDLYGFALLVINLLLGQLPYKPKESVVDIERALSELRKKQRGLPLGIWALLQMSLSNDPRERPKSASAIAREVINALKTQ